MGKPNEGCFGPDKFFDAEPKCKCAGACSTGDAKRPVSSDVNASLLSDSPDNMRKLMELMAYDAKRCRSEAAAVSVIRVIGFTALAASGLALGIALKVNDRLTNELGYLKAVIVELSGVSK